MTISVQVGSPVPVPEQIRYQIELQILGGGLAPGVALPSVRGLARKLRLSPGTVAAAYHTLEATGRVISRPGAGLFVAPLAPKREADTQGACHAALDELVRGGHSREMLAAAARAWAARRAVSRVVAIDTSLDMAELIAAELEQGLGLPVVGRALADLHPGSVGEDDLLVTPGYHIAAIRGRRVRARIEPIHVVAAPACREALRALPAHSLVLVITHAPAVLPFARAIVHGLRGEDVTLLTHERSEQHRWAGAAHAATLVLADALSCPEARAAGLTNVLEFRLVSDESIAALAEQCSASKR